MSSCCDEGENEKTSHIFDLPIYTQNKSLYYIVRKCAMGIGQCVSKLLKNSLTLVTYLLVKYILNGSTLYYTQCTVQPTCVFGMLYPLTPLVLIGSKFFLYTIITCYSSTAQSFNRLLANLVHICINTPYLSNKLNVTLYYAPQYV